MSSKSDTTEPDGDSDQIPDDHVDVVPHDLANLESELWRLLLLRHFSRIWGGWLFLHGCVFGMAPKFIETFVIPVGEVGNPFYP